MAKLGFIGGGNMAEAILGGAIGKLFPAAEIAVSEKLPARRDYLQARFPGLVVLPENAPVAAGSDTLVFAVKPQVMPAVLAEVGQLTRPDQLCISVCAGTRLATIERATIHPGNPRPRVVRVMPNTPALVGMGFSAAAPGTHATRADLDATLALFAGVGETMEVPESLMDAVTALTGSGPAYLFYLAESLEEAGTRMGFTREQAHAMVRALLRGSAELLATSAKGPAELRAQVTSPGGTTAAAIAVLDARDTKDGIVEAVLAAEARGRELGR